MRTLDVLVDTSIWIDHLSGGHEQLATLLRRRRIVMHPVVVGEVALGSMRNRTMVLAELHGLPRAPTVPNGEVIAMIERLELFGTGIGFADAHLVASARLIAGGVILTRDRALSKQAERLGVAFAA